jgi:hypothetical protein
MRILTASILFIVLFVIALLFSGCHQNQVLPMRWLIPTGYVGPIELEYGIPGAPTLPIEEGRYLIRLSRDGRAQTSTDIGEGRQGDPDDFYYISGEGRKRLAEKNDPYPIGTLPPATLVRGESSGVYDKIRKIRVFVGNDKQFDDYIKKHGTW